MCLVQAHGGEPLIPFSGSFESKLFDMPDDEKAAYCKEVRRCPQALLPTHQVCDLFPSRVQHGRGTAAVGLSDLTLRMQRAMLMTATGYTASVLPRIDW